jgi:predicted amidophosphoribosyltransferase
VHITALNHDFVQVVVVWKDQRARYLTQPLASHVVRSLPSKAEGLLVPIPVRHTSLDKRGWNPLLDLSNEISHNSRLNTDGALLQWKRQPHEQRGLTNNQRDMNMNDAFRVTRSEQRWVWLLDDVMTSGATLRSAARALRAADIRLKGCIVLAAPRMRSRMHS